MTSIGKHAIDNELHRLLAQIRATEVDNTHELLRLAALVTYQLRRLTSEPEPEPLKLQPTVTQP